MNFRHAAHKSRPFDHCARYTTEAIEPCHDPPRPAHQPPLAPPPTVTPLPRYGGKLPVSMIRHRGLVLCHTDAKPARVPRQPKDTTQNACSLAPSNQPHLVVEVVRELHEDLRGAHVHMAVQQVAPELQLPVLLTKKRRTTHTDTGPHPSASSSSSSPHVLLLSDANGAGRCCKRIPQRGR